LLSIEIESDLHFSTSLLTSGTNVMTLTTHARTWPEGVEYDYLRLEIANERQPPGYKRLALRPGRRA